MSVAGVCPSADTKLIAAIITALLQRLLCVDFSAMKQPHQPPLKLPTHPLPATGTTRSQRINVAALQHSSKGSTAIMQAELIWGWSLHYMPHALAPGWLWEGFSRNELMMRHSPLQPLCANHSFILASKVPIA